MASLRVLVAAVTADALAAEDIRDVLGPSIINLWATCVTITDTIGLRLNKTIIMNDGTLNISVAALGVVDTNHDQLIFNSLVGEGVLRMPVATLTTSLIFLLSVEPAA